MAKVVTGSGTATHWSTSEGQLQLEIAIPGNTTATVYLPTSDPSSVRESGEALEEAEGVAIQTIETGQLVLAIGAGQYRFTAAL